MVKKMVLIFLMTYVEKVSLRHYLVMWALAGFTAWSIHTKPMDSPVINRLQNLTGLVLTASVALTTPRYPNPSSYLDHPPTNPSR